MFINTQTHALFIPYTCQISYPISIPFIDLNHQFLTEALWNI